MHRARAAQFNPAGVLADPTTRTATLEAAEINLGARLSEREIRRTKTNLSSGPKHQAQEFGDRTFQMRHRNSAIHAQTFDLVEHGIVCRVWSVAAKDSTGSNHSDRRSASLHCVDLNCGRLRAQRQTFGRVESILLSTRGMILRNVQRVEVVEVSFDLAVVFDRIPERDENIFNPLAQKRDRMQMATTRPATGNRDIDAFAFRACCFNQPIKRRFSELDLLEMSCLDLLHQLAKRGALFSGHAADCLFTSSQRALLTKVFCAQLRQCLLLGLSLAQTYIRRRLTCSGKACKALELLFERFACCFNLEFGILLALFCHCLSEPKQLLFGLDCFRAQTWPARQPP